MTCKRHFKLAALVGRLTLSAPFLGLAIPPALAAEPVAIKFMEPATSSAKPGAPLFCRPAAAKDDRVTRSLGLLDNEAARFQRKLLGEVLAGNGPGLWEPGAPFYVVLKKGGNHAAVGLAIEEAAGTRSMPNQPYILLEATPDGMTGTFLHEAGHVLQSIARGASLADRDQGKWSAFLHTTFAVTDRDTALSEGYAIHFEALWGHFGSDPQMLAVALHREPSFGAGVTARSEFYRPVMDLGTWAQSRTRPQAVRDGWAAFQGHVYPGDYLRSQVDPARDRSLLKTPGQMVASEGVSANVLFWLAAERAVELGAMPGKGLEQPGIFQAEQELNRALGLAHALKGRDAIILDLVQSYGKVVPARRQRAFEIFLDVTHGVTVDPTIAGLWQEVHQASLVLDGTRRQRLFGDLEQVRSAVLARVLADPASLGSRLGPVLPYRDSTVEVRISGLGMEFPLAFDLNACGPAELAAVSKLDPAGRAKILAEQNLAPFASAEDFQRRTGVILSKVGLEPDI